MTFFSGKCHPFWYLGEDPVLSWVVDARLGHTEHEGPSSASGFCPSSRFPSGFYFLCQNVGSAAPGDDNIWRISAPGIGAAERDKSRFAVELSCCWGFARSLPLSCYWKNTQWVSKGRDVHRLQLQIPPTAAFKEFCFQRPLLRLKSALRPSLLIAGRGRNVL